MSNNGESETYLTVNQRNFQIQQYREVVLEIKDKGNSFYKDGDEFNSSHYDSSEIVSIITLEESPPADIIQKTSWKYSII